jgi:hypothetical protein
MHTLLQLKSKILPVWPSKTWIGFGPNTGAFSLGVSCSSIGAPVSVRIASSRSSEVVMVAHTLTFLSWPAAAKYLPSLENSTVQIALPVDSPFWVLVDVDVDARRSAFDNGPVPSNV